MRRRHSLRRGASLGMAIAAIAGSAAARSFDLQCDDTHYRIDLDAKRWCEDACETVSRLHYRGGNKVLLLAMADFSLIYDQRARRMTFTVDGPEGGGDTRRTRCRVLAFSGFPTDGAGTSTK